MKYNSKTLAKVCTHCQNYNNGVCTKTGRKTYVSRKNCARINNYIRRLKEIKRQRNQEEHLREMKANYEKRLARVKEVKKYLDDGLNNKEIRDNLNISKSMLKRDISFINELIQINKYIKQGLDNIEISTEINMSVDKIKKLKDYIKKNSDLFT